MSTRNLVSAITFLSAAVMAAAACQSGPAELPDEPASHALQRGPGRYFCGGFGGFPCPDGYVCEDDPNDDCDPESGGADCGGVCVAVQSDCVLHDDRDYISRDPEVCATILFLCVEGMVPFFDECGCGCEPATPTTGGGGVSCGANECAEGEYCCNPSCGICAPRGGACILIECE